jgi:hypothetical protein
LWYKSSNLFPEPTLQDQAVTILTTFKATI